MHINNNVKTMLADSHDPNVVSSKRVITLIAFILCCVAFIANLFFDYKMDQFIFDTMAYIVIGGFTVTGIEKFANRQNSYKSNDINRYEDFRPNRYEEYSSSNRWDNDRSRNSNNSEIVDIRR